LALGTTDAVMVLTRHDTHADYAELVLDHNLALFCEKPLALDEEELESVAAAWDRSSAPAFVGFNRRFSPAVERVKRSVDGHGPLQVVYRIFAGKLPRSHWYFDRSQGGRILGEVCHFVDTAGYIIGRRPVRVSASSDQRDSISAQNVSAHIDYEDGSTAVIVYGGQPPSGA